ncbi:MAG: hypothetical protein AAFV29_07205 [Myxococcota bacterium]
MAGILILPSSAFAFDDHLQISTQIGVQPSTGPLNDDLTLASPRLYGFFNITDHFAIAADTGFGVISGFGETEVHALNASLFGYYVDRTPRAKIRLGLGVALPTNRPDRIPISVISAARGLQDLWLYVPKTTTLIAPFRVEAQTGPVVLAVDGAAALAISENEDLTVITQLAVEVSAPLGPFDVGTRLGVVAVPTESGEPDADAAQISANPFVRVNMESVSVHAGLVFNLDRPFGWSFEDDRVLGIDAGVTVHW